MAKMTILGAREDQDEVLDSLMRSGAVEIVKNNELDDERKVSTASIDNVDLRVRLSRTIAVMQRRFPEAKRLSIQKLPVKEKDFLFTDKEENELRALVSRFEAQLEQEEAIAAKLSRLEQQVEQLLPWQDIPVDLSQHETARTKLIYGIFMDALSFESFESDLRRDYPLATSFFLEEEGLFPQRSRLSPSTNNWRG